MLKKDYDFVSQIQDFLLLDGAQKVSAGTTIAGRLGKNRNVAVPKALKSRERVPAMANSHKSSREREHVGVRTK